MVLTPGRMDTRLIFALVRLDQRRNHVFRSSVAEVDRRQQRLHHRRRHRRGQPGSFHRHLGAIAHVLRRVCKTELHALEVAFDRLAREHLEDAGIRIWC